MNLINPRQAVLAGFSDDMFYSNEEQERGRGGEEGVNGKSLCWGNPIFFVAAIIV